MTITGITKDINKLNDLRKKPQQNKTKMVKSCIISNNYQDWSNKFINGDNCIKITILLLIFYKS